MSATERMRALLDLALAEDRVALLTLMYQTPYDELQRLIEAAQLIDGEGVECLEGRED